MKPAPRKQEPIAIPKQGTKRFRLFSLMQQRPLTARGTKLISEFLMSTTTCPAEALLLAEDEFLRDDDWHHLKPIKEILIEAGFYHEMTTLVKPASLLFKMDGRVYYYPHQVPAFDWLDWEDKNS